MSVSLSRVFLRIVCSVHYGGSIHGCIVGLVSSRGTSLYSRLLHTLANLALNMGMGTVLLEYYVFGPGIFNSAVSVSDY
jgi:hypothetical protein